MHILMLDIEFAIDEASAAHIAVAPCAGQECSKNAYMYVRRPPFDYSCKRSILRCWHVQFHFLEAILIDMTTFYLTALCQSEPC